MLEFSDVTGKIYESEDCVFFRNIVQSAFYVHNNAKIIDVFTDSKGKLVMVFLRKEHDELINKWLDNKK